MLQTHDENGDVINKWDHWVENGKYQISYDDSDFTGRKHRKELATIKKALETLESKTHLKFVKYDNNTCAHGTHPCSWYMKFKRSEGISKSINLG